jgi:hypothetical protein
VRYASCGRPVSRPGRLVRTVTVHGKAPIGNIPPGPAMPPTPRPTGHHQGTEGQSQAGSGPGGGPHDHPHSLKRRNDTGSSRIPSRLAHRARPIRQSQADPTSSRLLPPSPATPGSGCLQLHPTATTAESNGGLPPPSEPAAPRGAIRSTSGPPRAPTHRCPQRKHCV